MARRAPAVQKSRARQRSGGGLRSSRSTPRIAVLVLRLAEAGAVGMSAAELLEAPALRELYSSTADAARQALNRDLRALSGGPLRSLRSLAPAMGESDPDAAIEPSGAQTEPLITRDPATGRYQLRAGIAVLRLSEAALDALCTLAASMGESTALPAFGLLLDQLGEALPPEQRAALATARHGRPVDRTLPRLELGVATADPIAETTLRQLRLALRQHRTIAFRYRPAHSGEGMPTRHQHDEVLEIVIGEHTYVSVWCEQAQRFLDLRVSRIVPESLELEPRVAAERTRRGVPIRYWASPTLVRGEITERLEHQTVERQDDGSAIVSGLARDLFRARRLLLGYGANARALAPEALVREMEREVREMAAHYGLRAKADSGEGDP